MIIYIVTEKKIVQTGVDAESIILHTDPSRAFARHHLLRDLCNTPFDSISSTQNEMNAVGSHDVSVIVHHHHHHSSVLLHLSSLDGCNLKQRVRK